MMELTGKVAVPKPHPWTSVPVLQPKSTQELIPFRLATAPEPMIAMLFGFYNGRRLPDFFSIAMPSRATARAIVNDSLQAICGN